MQAVSANFSFFAQRLSWVDALSFCIGNGGTFARILSPADHEAVVLLTGGSDAWIGGTDKDTEGTWMWVAGGSFPPAPDADQSYDNWATPERALATRG
eukprot:683916-Prymnesium_polylepis.1